MERISVYRLNGINAAADMGDGPWMLIEKTTVKSLIAEVLTARGLDSAKASE